MLLKVIDLNRCLNTINELQAQDMDHEKPFQEFSDFQPDHRGGVTEVISGGYFAQNRKKS